MDLRSALRAAALAVAFVLSTVGTVLATPGNGNGGNSSSAPGHSGTSPQATAPGEAKSPQSQGKGANTTGPYDPSGVGLPSGNGKSADNNGRRPCAGCVGKADAKNPPGQLPGGSDGNRGYECDGNEGVGKTNPAHSGCASTTTSPPENPPQSNPPGNGSSPPTRGNPPAATTPGPVVLGDRANGVPDDTSPAALPGSEDSSPSSDDVPAEGVSRLPFTGGHPLTLALVGALVLLAGLGVRRRLEEFGALR